MRLDNIKKRLYGLAVREKQIVIVQVCDGHSLSVTEQELEALRADDSVQLIEIHHVERNL